MSDLVAFLRARLEEDEDEVERARILVAVNPRLRDVYPGDDEGSKIEAFVFDHDFGTTVIGISPARVLAEVQAKRAILDDCEAVLMVSTPDFASNRAEQILYHLALPYADHPGYDESWRP